MTTSPKFCAACGAPLNTWAQFCGQCGRPIQTGPLHGTPNSEGDDPPSRDPEEPILGVIPYVSRQRTIFRSEMFNLVVTPRRLVFARVTDAMMKRAAREALEQARQEGKDILNRTAAMWRSRGDLWQRYFQMSIEDILAEQPGGFEIALDQVRSARTHAGDIEDNSRDMLTLETPAGKVQFLLGDTDARQTRNILAQVLGPRMK